jgi:hypothetical protein
LIVRAIRAIPDSVKRAALLLLVVACGSPETPRPPPKPGGPRVIPLVAARESGLYEITAEGRDVRRLSATPAQHPRWQARGWRIMFLTRDDRDAKELRAIEIGTQKEQVVARVRSRIDCPAKIELRVQDPADFVVGGTRACMRLMDRNSNMASYALVIHVDLLSGKSTNYLSLAPASCKLPRRESEVSCEDLSQDIVEEDDPPAAAPPPEIELPHAGPPGFTVHSRSPSGRWVLLRGNDLEGDYMHYQIVLYEVATKQSFPIAGVIAGGGPWPAPLTAEQLAFEPERLGRVLGDVVAETPVYWIRGREERLVVGEDLVVPGVGVVHVGQLAY